MSLLDNVIETNISWEQEMFNERKELKARMKRDLSEGSGELFRDERLYNKWLKYHSPNGRYTARDFADNPQIDDIALAKYEIYCTSEYFNIDFKEAIYISDQKYVRYEQGADLIDQDTGEIINDNCAENLKKWNLAKKVINNAFNCTLTKIENTISTLNKLKIDIPIELEKIFMVRKKYAKNQKREALTAAFKTIFKDISHEPTIEKIVKKALIQKTNEEIASIK